MGSAGGAPARTESHERTKILPPDGKEISQRGKSSSFM